MSSARSSLAGGSEIFHGHDIEQRVAGLNAVEYQFGAPLTAGQVVVPCGVGLFASSNCGRPLGPTPLAHVTFFANCFHQE